MVAALDMGAMEVGVVLPTHTQFKQWDLLPLINPEGSGVVQ